MRRGGDRGQQSRREKSTEGEMDVGAVVADGGGSRTALGTKQDGQAQEAAEEGGVVKGSR